MTVQHGTINVLSAGVIDPAINRSELTVAAGKTIAEIVDIALPGLSAHDRLHVRVLLVDYRGSMFVGMEFWNTVRPKEGVRVVIRLLPGKDVLRSILQIAVSIAAIALGQFWAPALAGTLGIGAQGWAAIIGLGVTVIGNLLINALIPPEKPLEAENRYQISGMRNRLDPNGAVPLALGTMRYAPPFGCYTYTEVVGDWQYLRGCVCAGYGPLNITGLQIGDTDISEYDEVEIEIRQGLSTDAPLSIITKQVVEETIGAELLKPLPRDDLGEITAGPATEEPVIRTTGADASGASVILAWPAGLVRYDKKGKAKAHTVSVKIDQRRIDATEWAEVTTIAVSARKLEAFYRQHTWNFPARGQYQIRCTMLTDETKSSQVQQRTTWAALQTIRPEYPFDFPHPLALISFRIKATHQLNGQLDNLNAVFSRPVLDYDHTSGMWIARETSNPASVYRYILQSPANPKAVADAGIDLDDLAAWHDFCRIHGLKFDFVYDEKTTKFEDLLSQIAAAGRATKRHNGLKWSVVIDRPDKPITDHFNPRNSYDFRVTRSYVEPPDAFRVSFSDATNGYKQAERLVPWPGKEEADLLLTEELQLPGKTDPAEIYREARRRMYEAIYRPDIYSVSKDVPAQIAVRGDRVRQSADVISRVQVTGRVLAVSGRLIELDEPVTMEAGKTYAIRFRADLSEENVLGTSVVRNLVTRAGTHRVVTVADEGDMPIPRGYMVAGRPYDGDLVHFGESAQLDFDLVVTGIEAGEDGSRHYRLVDAAPIIDELVDALVIPPWSGRAGAEIEETVSLPPAPRFTSIVSGVADTDVSGQIDYLIEPGSGGGITSRYRIYHRPVGGSWSNVTIPAANGGGSITGYANGQSVQIYARAINADGNEGPATTTVTFVIGANDLTIPGSLDSSMITVGALPGGAVIQFSTADDAAATQVQVYRSTTAVLNRATDAVGEPVVVQASRSYSIPLGDTTRQSLIVNGSFDGAGTWTLGTGWSIAGGKATKIVSSAGSSLSQPFTAASGKWYRIAYTLSGVTGGNVVAQLTGGSTRAGAARTANGIWSERIQAVSGNDTFRLLGSSGFAGNVDDIIIYPETATCLAQGVHYVWLEPQNDDGVPGPVSGPFAVTII